VKPIYQFSKKRLSDDLIMIAGESKSWANTDVQYNCKKDPGKLLQLLY